MGSWGHRNRAKVQQPLFREHMHEKWRELTREPLRSSPWSVAGSMPGGRGPSNGPLRSRCSHTAHRPEPAAGKEGPRAAAAWAGALLRDRVQLSKPGGPAGGATESAAAQWWGGRTEVVGRAAGAEAPGGRQGRGERRLARAGRAAADCSCPCLLRRRGRVVVGE